jgi:hypothetical protein
MEEIWKGAYQNFVGFCPMVIPFEQPEPGIFTLIEHHNHIHVALQASNLLKPSHLLDF